MLAISQLIKSKASDTNGFLTEFLKLSSEEPQSWIHNLIIHIWEESLVPVHPTDDAIITMFNDGDKSGH